jgi:hypothetical protein
VSEESPEKTGREKRREGRSREKQRRREGEEGGRGKR